jgi:hypothetical protein
MSRILIADEGRWYDELRAIAYYVESDLENWILQHAGSIFPDHFVFPFKKDVVSQENAAKRRPDLALVRRDFSAWAVVEVEVEGHELSHVLDQTSVFANGNYNAPEMAEYAQKQLKKFCDKTASLKRLTGLFSGHAPSVLVITDVHGNDWQEELNRTGIDFCVFEIYKNIAGHYVYRMFGQYPTVASEEAHCRPHASIPNLLEVIGDFTFKKLRKGRQVEVIYDECLTQWGLVEEEGKQYLRLVGSSNPLSPNASYGLLRDKSYRYYFKRN